VDDAEHQSFAQHRRRSGSIGLVALFGAIAVTLNLFSPFRQAILALDCPMGCFLGGFAAGLAAQDDRP
jgi:hypothetical protein